MKTGAIVAVTVQGADQGDTTTIQDTMIETALQMETLAADPESKLRDDFLSEVVADKGYHSNDTMTAFSDLGIRSYISEPDRGRRNWKNKAAEQQAVYANRRRIRGDRGKQLLRQRGLMLERPFAHTLETGAMRRVHLRNRKNILKRVLIQYAALNLSLLIRNKFGKGTPRGLQGQQIAALFVLILLWSDRETLNSDHERSQDVFLRRSSATGTSESRPRTCPFRHGLLSARGRSPEGRVTAKRGRIPGVTNVTTQRRDDETMRIHWEESATTKTAPFRRNPLGAGGGTDVSNGGRRRPAGIVRHSERRVTMKRRRPRPRFQTSVSAPHFAPATRRPLRAALGTSATGCYTCRCRRTAASYICPSIMATALPVRRCG